MADKVLKTAIIGGGRRCERIISMLEEDKLRFLKAEVVAVADINPLAPGFLKAKQKGIYTTQNYLDFFNLPDLDLVIELTGNEKLLEALLEYKPSHLRILDLAMSRLCEDLVCFETELQDKQREIESSRSYFQRLFSVVRDPIMVLRPDYTIVDANEALLHSVGLRRDEVVGHKCYEVSHRSLAPCDSPQHECPLREAISTRKSSHAMHEHHSGEMQTCYYDVSAYPLMGESGEVESVLEIWRDISATLEQHLEQKTRKIKEDLARLVHEDKMIALGKLVASAVHEINNPISAVHTFGKVMLRMVRRADGRMTPEDLKEMEGFLELVCSESKRCGEIVTNLLSFARHRLMTQRSLDVNEVMERILLLLKHKMELQKIQLVKNLDPGTPNISGDLNQVQQCLMNLIFNAMEAMPGGGTLTLGSRFCDRKNRVVVTVDDTGVGIPKEHLSRIFEPFFSTKSHDKGVGLGLAVVYGIIKEHRGEIEVDSEPGRGTTFRISFQLAEP